MPERPVKRLRRLSTEDDDDVPGSIDWIPQDLKAKGGASSSGRTAQPNDHITARSRTTRGVAVPASATVHRTSSAASGQRSIRLTVKAPPSKLRAVTMGSESPEVEKRPSSSASRSSNNKGRETLSRGSKNRPAIIEKDEDDDDMDVDMEEEEVITRPSSSRGRSNASTTAPPPPPATTAKPSLTFRIPKKPGTETKKPSPEEVLKAAPKITPVEDKELALASDDEVLSELGSDEIEGREEEEDEQDQEQDEDDESNSEADSDDEEQEEEEEEEDAEADSESDQEMTELPSALDQLAAAANESDSDLDTSQTGTPDPSRLTRRQRGAPDDTLLALSNEATKKKFLTAEQVTMRKAEMARRRKDLSEKRAQEEKDDTLKKLLEKQPSKKKGGVRERGEEEMEVDEDGEVVKFRAKAGWVRCVMGVEGTRVGVPEEWLDGPVGRVFVGCKGKTEELKVVGGTRLVQEVE